VPFIRVPSRARQQAVPVQQPKERGAEFFRVDRIKNLPSAIRKRHDGQSREFPETSAEPAIRIVEHESKTHIAPTQGRDNLLDRQFRRAIAGFAAFKRAE